MRTFWWSGLFVSFLFAYTYLVMWMGYRDGKRVAAATFHEIAVEEGLSRKLCKKVGETKTGTPIVEWNDNNWFGDGVFHWMTTLNP